MNDTDKQILDRLRRDNPGWRIEYGTNTSIPWTAHRRRTSAWRGGYVACEARNPETLQQLIDQAVQAVMRDEKQPASQEPSDAAALVGDDELHQLRDESRSTVSDRTLRRLTGDADPDQS